MNGAKVSQADGRWGSRLRSDASYVLCVTLSLIALGESNCRPITAESARSSNSRLLQRACVISLVTPPHRNQKAATLEDRDVLRIDLPSEVFTHELTRRDHRDPAKS